MGQEILCLRQHTTVQLLYISILFSVLLHLSIRLMAFFLDLHVSSFTPVEVCQNKLSFNDDLVQKMSPSYFKAQKRSQARYLKFLLHFFN